MYLIRVAVPTVAAILVSVHADAAAITGIGVTQIDSSDSVSSASNRTIEYRAENISTSGVGTSGTTLSFNNHFAWTLAEIVKPDTTVQSPNFAIGTSRLVGYELAFTIEDPTNVGYTLDIDVGLRGYVTAALDANEPVDANNAPAGTNPRVTVTGTTLFGHIGIDGGPQVGIGALSTSGNTAQADQTIALENLLASDSSNYNAGAFIGTHDFVLQFSNSPSANAFINMANYTRGEGALRFGLDPSFSTPGATTPDFFYGYYANAPDGEDADDHGHFVTVSANFTTLVAVPAPATLALFGFGLAALGLSRRR
jgi:hypothetical protein